MTREPLEWVAALGLSAAVHAGMVGLALLANRPEPVAAMPAPQSRIEVGSYPVPESRLEDRAPKGDPGVEARPDSPPLGQAGIPSGRAGPRPPETDALAASRPDAATLGAAVPESLATRAERVEGQRQAGSRAPASRIDSLAAAPAAALSAALPASAPAAVARPDAPVAVPARPSAIAVAAAPAPAAASSPRPVATAPTEATTPDPGPPLPDAALPASPGASVDTATASAPAPRRTPPSPVQVAELAWSGDGSDRFDPASLAAIQTFTAAAALDRSDADAGGVRDGIQALFGQVPCARLQAEYDLDTGTLELRGHVPEDGFRAPVLAALQEQIGRSIPVRDATMILPSPQCGVLTGIEATGLPQSTDQITNPRLVGADTHVRLYRFVRDDRLVLDLQAPDYPAYVQVDYFASDGSVIHLLPNAYLPAARLEPESVITLGGADGGLDIRIGPPYGQEIAVALASSVPLHDGKRPIQEPAGPYLDWLSESVAEARAADPAFKGEWVYFLVSTTEGN